MCWPRTALGAIATDHTPPGQQFPEFRAATEGVGEHKPILDVAPGLATLADPRELQVLEPGYAYECLLSAMKALQNTLEAFRMQRAKRWGILCDLHHRR